MSAHGIHQACPPTGFTNLEMLGVSFACVWLAMTFLSFVVVAFQCRRAVKAERMARIIPADLVPADLTVPREGLLQ